MQGDLIPALFDPTLKRRDWVYTVRVKYRKKVITRGFDNMSVDAVFSLLVTVFVEDLDIPMSRFDQFAQVSVKLYRTVEGGEPLARIEFDYEKMDFEAFKQSSS
jgi:hypothetical protein